MIALFALLSAPAHAGDVWLAGGLSATPTAADLLVPSWRLGADLGRVKPWLTVSYASFDTAIFGGDIDGYVLLPRVGARIDVHRPDAPKRAVSFVGVTATTRLGSLTDQDEPVTETIEAKASFPWGVGFTGGLDAPLNPALSLSAEIGGEYYHLAYEVDGDRIAVGLFDTLAAVHVNLWL